MSEVNPPRRAYRSQTREASAQQTRARILRVAARLFAERGYAATSFADIAAEARVARPTVFASFGSKSELLRQVLDVAMAGDDEPIAVRDRPWFQPVWQATTQVQTLRAYAAVCVLLAERAGPVFELVHRAADEGDDTSELWATVLRNRRAGADMVVGHLLELGPLPRGRARSVDLLWVLNDPALHSSLVGTAGWGRKAFTTWLGDTMCSTLLDAG